MRSARTPYDTYLSWYFRYAKNNQMYTDKKGRVPGPLPFELFERRYNQLRRASATNPARTVAMEQREATESQLRNTYAAIKRNFSKEEIRRIYGKDLTFKDIRKHYKNVFNTFFEDYDKSDIDEIFSPKEELVA